MVRLLYLHPAAVPPPQRESLDKFHFLSRVCAGDVLLPVWYKTPGEAMGALGAFPELQRGRFTYHVILDRGYREGLRSLANAARFFRYAWRLHRAHGYDVVMSYGTNSTGLAAALIARTTGARLVLEIPGVPEDAYLVASPAPRRRDRAKHILADMALNVALRQADRVKLLYPTQLAAYRRARHLPASVFHDFVPVAGLDPGAVDGNYVLLLGYPWYLKGVDILIKAFRAIAAQVPKYRLRIIGHFPDRTDLDHLAGGCPRIEILPPVSHVDALTQIGSCSLFVLPSRSEAMGRVLLEAMAAGKPIVASRVGGIPHYVQDGQNGLLVSPGSVAELGERMLVILTNPPLARRLGQRGRELALSRYDEASFARHFAQMLSEMGFSVPIVSSDRPQTAALTT